MGKHLRAASLALFATLAGVWLMGCGLTPPSEPAPPGGGDTRIYPSRTAPESVLVWLEIAWSKRDSSAIDSVYAADYSGTSRDLTDPDPAPVVSFTKLDEVRVIANISRDANVYYVNLDLRKSAWNRVNITSDPPDYVTISVPQMDIKLYQGNIQWEANSNSTFEFTLRPRAVDGLWEIVRWKEERFAL